MLCKSIICAIAFTTKISVCMLSDLNVRNNSKELHCIFEKQMMENFLDDNSRDLAIEKKKDL